MIKRILIYAMLLIALLALLKYVMHNREEAKIEEQAAIILERVENISKLMVVEGHFSEIYTYKKEESLFHIIPVEKKMVVIVKANAYVGYDLEKMNITVDKENQKLIIGTWPKAEVIIEPDVQYYDMQQSKFYSLDEGDLNRVNARAMDLIQSQVKASNLEKQAKERVVEVLENLMFTSKVMGWQVQYEVPELKQLD